jgi:hypothetical protein
MNTQVVKFQGTDILTFTQNNQYLIAIKPLCEMFGIDWEGQRQKINRDDLFNSTACVIQAVAADGKQREMTCLPLEVFPMWLARIDTNRVQNPYAAKLILEYQKEVTKVLYEHFFGADKLQLEKNRARLQYLRQDNITLFREKIIGVDRDYYHESRICWLLWKANGSTYSKAAAYTKLSTSALSTRVKKYQHYLDATRYQRQETDGYEQDEPDVFALHDLVKHECPSWEEFKRAVALGDALFYDALYRWEQKQRG